MNKIKLPPPPSPQLRIPLFLRLKYMKLSYPQGGFGKLEGLHVFIVVEMPHAQLQLKL